MEKVLNVKDVTNAEFISLFGRFELGNLLRHLSLEKLDGINSVTLILVLCLLRINGNSIFSACFRKIEKTLVVESMNTPTIEAE